MARNLSVLSKKSAGDIRKKIRQWLEDHSKVTREALAVAAGLSSSYLRVFLGGFCGITVGTSMRLAGAMLRYQDRQKRRGPGVARLGKTARPGPRRSRACA